VNIDPHAIQLILAKVREQLRCPQCTRRPDVQFDCLKVMSESFAVMQLQCTTCGAHVMLHATVDRLPDEENRKRKTATGERNASTELSLSNEEMEDVREALKAAGGSFSELFSERT
jgi:uncharacterized Zn finger protein